MPTAQRNQRLLLSREAEAAAIEDRSGFFFLFSLFFFRMSIRMIQKNISDPAHAFGPRAKKERRKESLA